MRPLYPAMIPNDPSPPHLLPERHARAPRYFFGIVGVSAFGAGVLAALDEPSGSAAWLFLLLALLSAAGAVQRGPLPRRAVAGLVLAGLAVVGAVTAQRGWGLNSPAVGAFALGACLVTALAGLRMGLATATVALALLLGLAYAETAQWIPGPEAVAAVPLWRRLGIQLLLLCSGVAGGVALLRLLRHHGQTAQEREDRFLRLLAIASDAYWEMDAQLRVTHLALREPDGRFVARRVRTPFHPWERPEAFYDPELLDAHRADLEAREPFRDVLMDWTPRGGEVRHLLYSGEPRFDARGVFLGYWGVWRDISEELRAREAAAGALRRSESLLSHLVATSPDVVTLTEAATGRYARINETFCRLTGWSAAEVIGRSSEEIGIWEAPADRQRILDELTQRPSVKDRPTTFIGRQGQRLSMLVSAARFSIDGVDYLVINARDVTAGERTRLEHEAMLANASLGIAFTRDQVFVQANRALEQMIGCEPGGLIGKPGRAVWASDEEYREIGALLGPKLARGEPAEIEREISRADGSRLWCRVLAKAVDPTHPMKGGTIWIVEDFSERRRVAQALARARDEAEAANRAKSAFLANTSHEIRTPLNGLLGLARLARQPQLDEARRRQYLEQMGDSAETLSALISDILDLSKIEAGRLHVECAAFDLAALLRALHRGYAALADARGLSFQLELDERLPEWVSGDPMRLRQVLSNYLANALKFTQEGGMRLACRVLAGQRVRFEVHDSGPGVDEQILSRLFHPFTQADESTTRRYGGTGLGLSICRELAVLMDGEVGAVSRVGHGSCFWVELPLPPCEAADGNSGFGALEEPSRLAGARVLLAEDNPVNMMIAATLLEQWGIEVEQASDGAAAVAAASLAAAQARPFDAVLMDVQMPVMGGYEAARRLREDPATQGLPLVALTAAALVSEREEARAAGMAEFLTKPIDAARLHATLLRVTGR